MPVVSDYTLNTFSFPGYCSGDAAACSNFYSKVLGWNPEEVHTPDGTYTSFKIDGVPVAGMYQMADERKAAGVRPHWNSYLIVNDVDAIAREAEELGGKVLQGPFDAMGDRMANLQDPEGAKFSVWQSRKPQPDATRLHETGSLCWTELYANNPDAQAAFYSQLLGWQPQPFEASPTPYTVFNIAPGESAWAGMAKICPEMEDMSPGWMPYFMVDDTDETVQKARGAGAQVHGPMDIPTVGRIAFIADPEGATFGIIKPAMP